MINTNVKAVIFDLDGTLIDSLEDIADCSNKVLSFYGLSAYPLQSYRQFVGDGLFMLMKRIMPEETTSSVLKDCTSLFSRIYEKNWQNKTRPYPGIKPMLDQLIEMNIKISVLSNKPDLFTRECVSGFFPDYPFSPVQGQTETIRPKPAPDGACKIAKDIKVPVDKIIFIGDSNVDIKTGLAANMTTVGVSWGFRPEEELLAAGAQIVINHPEELLHHVRNF